MTTFWQDIAHAAGDEPIEAVVIGDFGYRSGTDDSRDVTADRRHVVLTAAQAEPLLSYDYDTGYGGADCHAVYAWTATRTLLVHEYDGSTGIVSVPRNPGPCEPSMSGDW